MAKGQQSGQYIYIGGPTADDTHSNPDSWANAWATLDKLRTYYDTDGLPDPTDGVPTGKTIYLRKGETFVGTITVKSSATNVSITTDPTTADPGTEPPMILGSVPIGAGSLFVVDDPGNPNDGDWVPHTTGIWKIQLVPGVVPKYLFDGDDPQDETPALQTLARTPNVGTWMRNKIYRTDDNTTTANSADDWATLYPFESLPADIEGAEIVVAPFEVGWRRDVTAILTGDEARVLVTFGLQPI